MITQHSLEPRNKLDPQWRISIGEKIYLKKTLSYRRKLEEPADFGGEMGWGWGSTWKGRAPSMPASYWSSHSLTLSYKHTLSLFFLPTSSSPSKHAVPPNSICLSLAFLRAFFRTQGWLSSASVRSGIHSDSWTCIGGKINSQASKDVKRSRHLWPEVSSFSRSLEKHFSMYPSSMGKLRRITSIPTVFLHRVTNTEEKCLHFFSRFQWYIIYNEIS